MEEKRLVDRSLNERFISYKTFILLTMGYELLIFACREKAQVYVDSMIKLGSLS